MLKKQSLTTLFIFISAAALIGGCVSAPVLAPLGHLAGCQSVSRNSDSIVGGEEVSLGDPDQKLVTMIKIHRNNQESICTGTLISDRVVLTAAHCVDGVKPAQLLVQFETAEGCPINHVRKVDAEVIKTVIHKDFDGTPQSLADLGMIYLQEKAPEQQQRLPILKQDQKPTKDRILLVGFGITDEQKKDSQTLRRIYKSLKEDLRYRERAVFVDQKKNHGGFCRGDSGAPILAEVWGEPHILAVNSANIGITPHTECQTASLAMNVLPFSEWILKNQQELDSMNWWNRFFIGEAQVRN